MTLQVWTKSDHAWIELGEDTTALLDGEGLRIMMESGVGRVVVCELGIDDARELSELIAQALKTYA